MGEKRKSPQKTGKKAAASGSKYGADKAYKVNRENVKKTWKIRPPQEWLALLKEVAPEHKWEMKGHTLIKGRCPYHNDKSPSFILNFDKGIGKCFGAGCEKVVVDITNLVAKLRTCSYMEALLFIYNRFNMGDAFPASVEDFSEYNRVQEMKKAVAVGMSKIVSLVLSPSCPPYMKYCKPGIKYLTQVRGIPEKLLPMLPVGIWAKPVHIKQELPDKYHLVFDKYFEEVNTPGHYGSLCFYYNDSPGSISRFKLRHIHQATADKLAAHPRKLKDVELLKKLYNKGETQYIRDPYLGTAEVGVFGLYFYQALIGKNDTNAYLTEGEFDVLSTMAAQMSAGTPEFMMFGSGGKGSTDVQFLREYGVRTVWLVGDHPTKQGYDWVRSILQTKNNFAGSAGVTPLQFKVFQWPVEVSGGDLDEAIQQMTFSGMEEYLYIERNKYFLNHISWINKEVDEKILAIQQEVDAKITKLQCEGSEKETAVSNIEAEKKSEMETAILQGFRLVHNPQEKQGFVRRCASEYNIDVSSIDSVHSAMYALDTSQGVTDMVSAHLNDYFELSYYIRRGNTTNVYAWSKKNQELIDIPLADKPLPKIIALHVGQEIEQWFDSILPNNPIYCEDIAEGDFSLKASQKRRKNATYIVEKAFEQQLGKMHSYDTLTMLSQGVHHNDLSAELRQEGYLYFVNGPAIYRGKYLDVSGDMEWHRLTNAVDKNIVFEDLSISRQWSETVLDITDLYEAPVLDLNKTFSDICTILNGWAFKNHEPIVELMAAYIMSIPIMRAMADTNIIILTGEKASGKTTFSAGLLGGNKGKRNACPSILESVKQMDNTTLASIYQQLQGKSSLVVFDEAEHGDQYNSRHNEMLDEVIRLAHSMPHGGVTVNRGGRVSAEAVEYFLRFPILMSAINPPMDHTFLSRTFEVRTNWKENHTPAEEHIYNKFTEAQLKTLNKQITIGLLPRIPELIATRKKLATSLPKIGQSIARIDNRFLHNLLTPLSVLEFLGRDTKGIYQKIITTNKDRLESIHSSNPQNDLLNTCLYAKSVRVVTSDHMTDYVSPQELLVQENTHILNNSNTGIYFIFEMSIIVIVWRHAKFGALTNTKYSSWDVTSLKEFAGKSDNTWTNVNPSQHHRIVSTLDLKDVTSHSAYSVVDISYLMAGLVKLEEENKKKQEPIDIQTRRKKRKDTAKKEGPTSTPATGNTGKVKKNRKNKSAPEVPSDFLL